MMKMCHFDKKKKNLWLTERNTWADIWFSVLQSTLTYCKLSCRGAYMKRRLVQKPDSIDHQRQRSLPQPVRVPKVGSFSLKWKQRETHLHLWSMTAYVCGMNLRRAQQGKSVFFAQTTHATCLNAHIWPLEQPNNTQFKAQAKEN